MVVTRDGFQYAAPGELCAITRLKRQRASRGLTRRDLCLGLVSGQAYILPPVSSASRTCASVKLDDLGYF